MVTGDNIRTALGATKSGFRKKLQHFFGRTPGEKAFNIFNYLFFAIVVFCTAYPFIYCLDKSFIANKNVDGTATRIFSFSAYVAVFKADGLMSSFLFSVAIVIVFTCLSVFLTMMAAYALAEDKIKGRKFFSLFVVFTMLFSGGLIPYYLLIKDLGLRDNILVHLIPGLFSGFNIIIAKSFIKGIPISLKEAAKIDGANEFLIFIKIYMPLSLPIIATLALWVAVGKWNDWMTGQLYIKNPSLFLIQNTLRRILLSSSTTGGTSGVVDTTVSNMSESVKMATVIVGTLPIVLAYPFVQKYFIQGMNLGAVKG